MRNQFTQRSDPIQIRSFADSDPHHFGKLDPDPHLHQSAKLEALGGHFGVLEGPNLQK
jgi:hypothetical protein